MSRRRSASFRPSASASDSSSSASTTASSPTLSRCSSAPSSASPRPRSRPCSGSPLAALAVLALIGRPLLFASVDAEIARARGLPTRALALAFLLLLGMAVAATAEITGALLVFALAGDAGGDRAADHRPARASAWRSRWRSPSPSPGSASGSLTSRPIRSASGSRRSHSASTSWCGWRPTSPVAPGSGRRRPAPDVRPRIHAQRLPRRHLHRPRLWARSGTSSCFAVRSSPATRSATSPSPAPWRPRRRESTFGSASSPRRSSSRPRWACSASALAPTTW